MTTIKFKLEQNNNIYELDIRKNEDFLEKQIKVVSEIINSKEEAVYYHLYNNETKKFIEDIDKLNKKTCYIMKNTSKEAQTAVSTIKNILSKMKENNNLTSTQASELKILVFNLKNYLLIDSFAEEFIAYAGLENLIEAIQEISGNIRSYAINSLKSILVFKNAIEYIRENPVVVYNLYNILMSNSLFENAMSTIITHTLGILFLLCDVLKDEGVSMILNAADKYAEENDKKIFNELVGFLYNTDIQVKLNTMTLIYIMIKSCNKKSKQNKILALLNNAELIVALNKNGDLKSDIFQNQLSNFQKLTGELIKGSYYEIELYKCKVKDIENHCYHLEKKLEYIFLNQRFYNEVVEDFIAYQQMADTALEIGGYYDPCKIYKYVK